MALVVLVSVKWDVNWILIAWWDDGYMSIGPLGVGRESSRLRFGDGKNVGEP